MKNSDKFVIKSLRKRSIRMGQKQYLALPEVVLVELFSQLWKDIKQQIQVSV